jgi:hypothetical protein
VGSIASIAPEPKWQSSYYYLEGIIMGKKRGGPEPLREGCFDGVPLPRLAIFAYSYGTAKMQWIILGQEAGGPGQAAVDQAHADS